MIHSSRTSVGARVSDAAGDALDATTHAIDSGKQFASDTADKIGETARDLRDTAADLARTGADSVSDAAGAAQRQLGRYAGATRRYVADEPLKSALVSAAIGAVAAMLVMAISRSRRDRD
jgi:ElaB/YqjD/DUF883 family membrane-anchored ribosome-binding protein